MTNKANKSNGTQPQFSAVKLYKYCLTKVHDLRRTGEERRGEKNSSWT